MRSASTHDRASIGERATFLRRCGRRGGLSGLLAARTLDRAGLDVLVLEAQDRVGGRALTTHLDETTFIDDGGQWVSPNQARIVALAAELGVELFPSWGEGHTVLVRDGKRIVADGLFLNGDGDALGEAKRAAEPLAAMAEPHEGRTSPEVAIVVRGRTAESPTEPRSTQTRSDLLPTTGCPSCNSASAITPSRA